MEIQLKRIVGEMGYRALSRDCVENILPHKPPPRLVRWGYDALAHENGRVSCTPARIDTLRVAADAVKDPDGVGEAYLKTMHCSL